MKNRKLIRTTLIMIILFVGVIFSASADESFLLRSSFGPKFSTHLQVTLDPSIYWPKAFDFTTDGKIVIVGQPEADAEITVQRLLADGSLDTTFDTDGIVSFFIEPGIQVNDVAVYDDGRILLVGHKGPSTSNNAFAMRLNVDGTPDTSFFTTGTAWLGAHSRAHQVIILPNEKILIAGTASAPSTFALATIFRLHVNGTFDNSFGTGGKAQIDIDPDTQRDEIYDFFLTPSGKIVGSGIAQDVTDNWSNLFVTQFTSNGQLDTSFGDNGIYTHEDSTYAEAVAGQENGKILFSGRDTTAGVNVLGRLNANGTPDTTFDTDGLIDLSDPLLSDVMPQVVENIIPYEDGRIMLDGVISGQTTLTLVSSGGTPETAFNDDGLSSTFGIGDTADIERRANGQFYRLTRTSLGGTPYAAIQRIHPDGSFDTGGRVIVNHTEGVTRDETARAIAVSQNGSLYVAGTVNNGSVDQFTLHRFSGKGVLDTSYAPSLVSNFAPWDIALDDNNRAVVVGKYNGTSGFHIRRYLSNGTLDLSVTEPLGNGAEAHAILIQPDGKLIIGGKNNNEFTVARFFEDGTLDTTFGVNGIATHDFGGQIESVTNLAFGQNGEIVAQGSSWDFSNYATVMQFTADGAPDTTFTPYLSNVVAVATGLTVQSDGKILSTGTFNGRWTVFRQTTNGEPDISFGAGGYKMVYVESASGFDVMVQADGKIVTVGCVTVGQQDVTTVVRMDTYGVFDFSFSDDGKAKFLLGTNTECARAVASTRDSYADYEDMFVVGNAQATNNDDTWGLLRLKAASGNNCVVTAAPQGFNVDIVPVGVSQQDADLSWSDYNGTYTVHQSSSDPYFTPQAATTIGTPPDNYFTHSSALDNPASNNFYVVEANNCDGNGQSERIGTFSFEVVAGN